MAKTTSERELIEAINSDPRVEAFARNHGVGFLNAKKLSEITGLEVPSTWIYKSTVGRGGRGVTTNDGAWAFVGNKIIPVAAGALLTYGVGSAIAGAGAASNATAAIPGAADAPALSTLLGTAPKGAGALATLGRL